MPALTLSGGIARSYLRCKKVGTSCANNSRSWWRNKPRTSLAAALGVISDCTCTSSEPLPPCLIQIAPPQTTSFHRINKEELGLGLFLVWYLCCRQGKQRGKGKANAQEQKSKHKNKIDSQINQTLHCLDIAQHRDKRPFVALPVHVKRWNPPMALPAPRRERRPSRRRRRRSGASRRSSGR